MAITYDSDIIAWSKEQAHLIRSGQFDKLDLIHLAEEIEDVGKSEYRELSNRMALLICHLLKWKYQPERHGSSWESTINLQRKMLTRRIQKTPSLKTDLYDLDWFADSWDQGLSDTIKETNIKHLPETAIWSQDQILDFDFWPD